MGRRRMGLGGLTVVAMVLYAIALVAVIDRGRPPDASELLARARRFTDRAGQARVALNADSSPWSAASTGTGVVAFPDRYRVRWDEDENVREEVHVGRQTWQRY